MDWSLTLGGGGVEMELRFGTGGECVWEGSAARGVCVVSAAGCWATRANRWDHKGGGKTPEWGALWSWRDTGDQGVAGPLNGRILELAGDTLGQFHRNGTIEKGPISDWSQENEQEGERVVKTNEP